MRLTERLSAASSSLDAPISHQRSKIHQARVLTASWTEASSDRRVRITSLCPVSGYVACEDGAHGSCTPPEIGRVSGVRNGIRRTPLGGADVGE